MLAAIVLSLVEMLRVKGAKRKAGYPIDNRVSTRL